MVAGRQMEVTSERLALVGDLHRLDVMVGAGGVLQVAGALFLLQRHVEVRVGEDGPLRTTVHDRRGEEAVRRRHLVPLPQGRLPLQFKAARQLGELRGDVVPAFDERLQAHDRPLVVGAHGSGEVVQAALVELGSNEANDCVQQPALVAEAAYAALQIMRSGWHRSRGKVP